MAYDSTNKILSTEGSGITLWEIAQCLGDYRVNTAGRRDVGMLCTSPKINKWAKYKPERRPSWTTLTDAHRAANNYGFVIPHDVWWNLMSLDDDSRKFNYLRPQGGTASPYRIRDFDGYNHAASPIDLNIYIPSVVHGGINSTVMVTVLSSDADALSFADFTLTTGTTSTSPTLPLSEWHVMLLYTIGSATYLYNSQKTIADNVGLPIEITLDGDLLNVGDTIKVLAVLGYDSNIPAGTSQLSQANGDYHYDYFVPLNLTDAFEAEAQRTVTRYKIFNTFSVTLDTIAPPQTGKNYYSFGSFFVFTAQLAYPSTLTYTFQYEIYIKRGNEVIQTESSIRSKTITFTWHESLQLATYDFGAINFEPITATQSGDQLYLKVTYIGAPLNEVLYDKVIYTHE